MPLNYLMVHLSSRILGFCRALTKNISTLFCLLSWSHTCGQTDFKIIHDSLIIYLSLTANIHLMPGSHSNTHPNISCVTVSSDMHINPKPY